MSDKGATPRKTLVDAYLDGEIPDDQLEDAFDRCVSYFHEVDSSVDIRELMGMTLEEYSQFARNPEQMAEVLKARPLRRQRLMDLLEATESTDEWLRQHDHLRHPYPALQELHQIAFDPNRPAGALSKKICQTLFINQSLPFLPVFLISIFGPLLSKEDVGSLRFFLLNGPEFGAPGHINDLCKTLDHVAYLLRHRRRPGEIQLAIGSLLVTVGERTRNQPEELINVMRLAQQGEPPQEAKNWARALAEVAA